MSSQLEILKEDIESLTKRLNSVKEEYSTLLTRDLRRKLFSDSDLDTFKLIDRIHNLICNYNHTDGCGYLYENWNLCPDGRYSEKGRWLENVMGWIKKFGVEKVVRVCNELEIVKSKYKWINITTTIFEEELSK